MPQALFLSTGVGAHMNYPVNNSDFKIFRNINNTIWVYVKDVDRKTVIFPVGTVLTINICDHDQQKLIYSGNLSLLDSASGRYSFTITDTDISDWSEHSYTYSIVASDNTGSNALYTDRGYSLSGYVTVLDGPVPKQIVSVVISFDSFLSLNNSFISSAYSGAARNKNLSGLHTIAIYGDQLTGTLNVQASLENTPPSSDSLWATVSTISLNNLSDVQRQDFVGNYTWVRFQLSITAGSLEKILYRG